MGTSLYEKYQRKVAGLDPEVTSSPATTNLYEKYRQATSPAPESDNPITGVYTRMKNLTSLLAMPINDPIGFTQMIKSGYKVGAEAAPQAAEEIKDTFSDLPGVAKGMWSATKKTGDALIDRAAGFFNNSITDTIGGVATGAIEGAGSIASIPLVMLNGVIDASSKTLTGVDLSKQEGPVVSSVDEVRKASKAFVANTIGLAVGIGVEQAIAKGFAAGAGQFAAVAGETLPGAAVGLGARTTPELLTIGTQTVRVGRVGQTMIEDTIGGLVGGTTQAMIQESGDAAAQGGLVVTNFMFAPLGTMFGYARGTKMLREGNITPEEAWRGRAIGIAHLRQLQVAEDASIEGILGKASAILSSDDVSTAAVNVLAAERSIFALRGVETIDPPEGFQKLYNKTTGTTVFAKDGLLAPEEMVEFMNSGTIIRKGDTVTALREDMKWTKEPAKSAMDDAEGNPIPRTETVGTIVFHKGKEYEVTGRQGNQIEVTDNFGNPHLVERGFVEANPVKITTIPDVEIFDTLYRKFKKDVDGTKPFEPQIAAFVLENKLERTAAQVRGAIAKRYAADLMGEDGRRLMGEVNKTLLSDYKEDLVSQANRLGMFVEKGNGAIMIRDIRTGEIYGSVSTTEQARKFLNLTEGPIRGDNINTNSLIPDGYVPAPGVPTAMTAMDAASIPYENLSRKDRLKADFREDGTNLERALNQFNVGVGAIITTPRDWFRSVDAQLGTNTSRIFQVVEPAAAIAARMSNQDLNGPRLAMIRGLAKDVDNESMEKIGAALEAANRAELVQPGGYSKSHKVIPDDVRIGDFLVEKNIYAPDVLKYAREERELLIESILKNRKDSLDALGIKDYDDIPVEQMREILNGDVTEMPYFQKKLEKIRTRFGVTPEFDQAVKELTGVLTKENGPSRTGFITRYSLAGQNEGKNHLGMSRAEFMDREKFTPQMRELTTQLEVAYQDFGRQFGIMDSRQLRNYMAHYRQTQDLFAGKSNERYVKKIGDNVMSEFISGLIRTGEIADYEMNPMLNLASYIRAGHKAKHLYPVTNRIFSADDGYLALMLDDPNISERNRVMIRKKMLNYAADVTGQPTESARDAQQALVNKLVAKGKNEQEIREALRKRSVGDMVLTLSNLGLMGGRPIMGARDFIDVSKKYYIRYGDERLSRLLLTKIDDTTMKRLLDEGIINHPEISDFYSLSQATGQVGGRKLDELSKVANDATFQPYVYLKMSAAVYEEALDWNLEHAQKLVQGKITVQEFRKATRLVSFDAAREIETGLTRGGMDPMMAARIMATEEKNRSVGLISRSNRTPMSQHGLGKFLGHLGSWANANRTDFFQMFTRVEDATDAMAVARRYAYSEAATLATGKMLGLDMSRWMFLPMSVVSVNSGPVLEAVKGASSAATSQFGTEQQRKYTNREFMRGLTQFIPFWKAVGDPAMDMYKHPDASDAQHLVNSLGLPVDWNSEEGFLK